MTGLLLLNQVCFTVHVLRVHGGDPSFVARYLPVGWFEMAGDNPVLRALAAHCPVPVAEALAPSLLRVPALLELPFVLLAYATVLRWLDPALYRRVFGSPLLWLASLAYTAVFCVVEADLRNPYTGEDLVVRAVSGVVTPLLLAAAARRDSAPARPHLPAARLLVLAGSLAALGALVLVAYDTVLLYSLGRLGARLPLAAVCGAVLVGLRMLDVRLAGRPATPYGAGPALGFAGHALRRWLALFFAPALAVRYGVTFGTPWLAALAALAVAAAGALHGIRDALPAPLPAPLPGQERRRQLGVLLAEIGVAVLAGAAVAYGVARTVAGTGSGSYYETALLCAGVAFLTTALTVAALGDALVRAGRERAAVGRRDDVDGAASAPGVTSCGPRPVPPRPRP